MVITKSISQISCCMPVMMEIARKLAFSKPPIGICFEDTGLNTLNRDSFHKLAMCEAMAIQEGYDIRFSQFVKQMTREKFVKHSDDDE